MMKNLLYVPLSWLYTLGVTVRHWLYDRHVLLSHTVEIPVIGVGNLAVGGTGKTPMVEYLVRLLTEQGFHVAVLSRGYKRKTHGFVLADADATTRTIGDEAMQLHHKFPSVPVAVCESRVRGVRQLQRQIPGLDVVVLDDAFQHRAIRCGLNILLTPYDRLYIDDHMLPWGRLRDIPRRALKADIIVVTKCPADMQPIQMRVVDNRLHLPSYQQLYFTALDYASIGEQGTPLVLCGIAQPMYMMEYVQQLFPHAELMAFPDHHAYSPRDVEAILVRAKNFDFVLTTEKDMQRLFSTTLAEQLQAQGKHLVALPVQMRFMTAKETFDKQVIDYVRENTRHK